MAAPDFEAHSETGTRFRFALTGASRHLSRSVVAGEGALDDRVPFGWGLGIDRIIRFALTGPRLRRATSPAPMSRERARFGWGLGIGNRELVG
jgi:hypothetical protein